jgi:hypothetical protein
LGRSLALARTASDRQLEGHALDGLAQVAATEGDARRARTLASRAVELARAVGNRALEVDALTTLSTAWRGLGDPAAAAAVARAALRAAGSRGSPARVARAMLELASSIGPDGEQAGLLLDAIEHDPRVPARLRAAAARVPRVRRSAEPATTLDDAWLVTLG